MTDLTGSLPPAGWHLDPGNHRQIRWWNGTAWSEHVAPVPQAAVATTTPQAAQPVPTPSSTPPVSAGAAGVAAATVAASADVAAATSASPSVTAVAPVTRAGSLAASATGYGWDREARDNEGANFSTAEIEADVAEWRAIPHRWATLSVWMLAATPLVVAFSIVGVAVMAWWWGSELSPRIAGPILLPYLWGIAFAYRDIHRLKAWGHRKTASVGWAFLGAPVYLIARTVVMRRYAKMGLGAIWLFVVFLVASAGGLYFLASMVVSAYVPTYTSTVQQAIQDELTATGPTYTVSCPAMTDVMPGSTFVCSAKDSRHLSGTVTVRVADWNGSYSYMVSRMMKP